MSLFSIGGNLGYSLGVIVTTPIVVALGIEGGALVVLPCLAVAAMLLWLVPFLLSFVPRAVTAARAAGGDDRLGAMALLLGVVTVRSVAWFGLITFVPLWEVSIGNSEGYGNLLLSIMLLAGAVGTLLAGPAADRFGRRPVLLVSNLVVPPRSPSSSSSAASPARSRWSSSAPPSSGTFGVTMVMSQEYMPQHIGMASGPRRSGSRSASAGSRRSSSARSPTRSISRRRSGCAPPLPLAGIVLTLLLPPTRSRRALAPEIASP